MGFEKQKFLLWVKQYSDYDGLSHRATEAFTGWTGKDPNVIFSKSREVIDVLEEVIVLVERFARDVDVLSSKEKMEAAVDCIDDWVKFPFFLEWLDDIIIKYMVATIVEQKNKWFGKNWFDAVG